MATDRKRRAVPPDLSKEGVVSKAALRAAAFLDMPNKVLARVIGLSEASVSRMGAGTYKLAPGEKPFELAVLFVRFYRSLDALVHGDDTVARTWLTSPNDALGGTPVALIQSVTGLVHVAAYLDARRALL